jgi:putative endonuclease
MKYVVYILESQFDGTFYIGYTSDLEKRLSQHNSGKTKYTSRKIPWKVVYREEITTKSEALKRERFLKKQRNRDFYLNLIRKN